jgi:hypothetical protein
MPYMTQEAVNAHQARHSPKPQPSSAQAIADGKESELHRHIKDECMARGWIALHGSMAHRAHRTIGEADFCCLLPCGVTIFVECKTKSSKLSQAQMAIQAWMHKLGHQMHVVRSLDQFQTICREAMTATHAVE